MSAISTTSSHSTLPADFTPGDCHIIIGRGHAVRKHSGNVKFDQLIREIAHEYSSAVIGKTGRGQILSRLMDKIHNVSVPGAGFVKKDFATGRWQTVEECLARTTAAQAIRNLLAGEYRSSSQFKSQRRQSRLQNTNKKIQTKSIEGTVIQIPSSESAIDFARCVAPLDPADKQSSSEDIQTFDILFSVFGTNPSVVLDTDPFTPVPFAQAFSSQFVY